MAPQGARRHSNKHTNGRCLQLECGDGETWRHKELEDTPINIQMDVVQLECGDDVAPQGARRHSSKHTNGRCLQLECGDDETWRHKELEDTPINIQMDVVFSWSVVIIKHGATRS